MYSVYIKVDTDNYITAIDSDIFISDTSDWTKIDEGEGDKYAHAQSSYLPKPITDEQGRYNYKCINAEIVEVSDDEKPVITPTNPLDTVQGVLNAMAQDLLDNKPAYKKGFDCVLTYSNNGSFVWEFVPTGDIPSGDYLNPTEWVSGMQIYAGVKAYADDGWYVFEGLVQRCIKDGTPTTFDDTEYWEVI